MWMGQWMWFGGMNGTFILNFDTYAYLLQSSRYGDKGSISLITKWFHISLTAMGIVIVQRCAVCYTNKISDFPSPSEWHFPRLLEEMEVCLISLNFQYTDARIAKSLPGMPRSFRSGQEGRKTYWDLSTSQLGESLDIMLMSSLISVSTFLPLAWMKGQMWRAEPSRDCPPKAGQW